MSVEKQTRQVLDELDYLNEWFADAHDRLLQVVLDDISKYFSLNDSPLCSSSLYILLRPF